MEVTRFRLNSSFTGASESFWKGRSGLFIWHVDKTPPHIGLVIHTDSVCQYYSLKVHGVDVAVDIDACLSVMVNKNINSYFIEILHPFDVEGVKDLYSSFKHEKKLISCLSPIVQLLQAPQSITKLEELLLWLKENAKLGESFIYPENLSIQYLNTYDYADIQKRLVYLDHVRRHKNTVENS